MKHEIFYEDLVGDRVKSSSDVRVESIYCSRLIYQATQFIADYQVSQIGILLCESMLITPNCLLVHVPASVSSISCSMTLSGIKVRLNSL